MSPGPTLPPDFDLVVRIGGLKIRVELDPGCLAGGRRIRLRARHPIAGSAGLTGRRPHALTTESEVVRMLRRLRLAPCAVRGCKNPRLVGDDGARGRAKEICEPHRLKALHRAAAKPESRKGAPPTVYDEWMRRKGFRYLATLWIYPSGRRESAVGLYFRRKPTRAELRKEAERRQSHLLDDYYIQEL